MSNTIQSKLSYSQRVFSFLPPEITIYKTFKLDVLFNFESIPVVGCQSNETAASSLIFRPVRSKVPLWPSRDPNRCLQSAPCLRGGYEYIPPLSRKRQRYSYSMTRRLFR